MRTVSHPWTPAPYNLAAATTSIWITYFISCLSRKIWARVCIVCTCKYVHLYSSGMKNCNEGIMNIKKNKIS